MEIWAHASLFFFNQIDRKIVFFRYSGKTTYPREKWFIRNEMVYKMGLDKLESLYKQTVIVKQSGI